MYCKITTQFEPMLFYSLQQAQEHVRSKITAMCAFLHMQIGLHLFEAMLLPSLNTVLQAGNAFWDCLTLANMFKIKVGGNRLHNKLN